MRVQVLVMSSLSSLSIDTLCCLNNANENRLSHESESRQIDDAFARCTRDLFFWMLSLLKHPSFTTVS